MFGMLTPTVSPLCIAMLPQAPKWDPSGDAPPSSVSFGCWEPFCSTQLPDSVGIRVCSRMPKSVGTSLRLNTLEGEDGRKIPAEANFRVKPAAVPII